MMIMQGFVTKIHYTFLLVMVCLLPSNKILAQVKPSKNSAKEKSVSSDKIKDSVKLKKRAQVITGEMNKEKGNILSVDKDTAVPKKITSSVDVNLKRAEDLKSIDAKEFAKDKLKKSLPTGQVNGVSERISGAKINAKNQVDSIKHAPLDQLKKQLKSVELKGSISAGYQYGVLPYVTGEHNPIGGFKSEGNVSFLMFNLPLELTYRYSTIKNFTGINNYFRVSYDAARYKEQLDKIKASKERLTKLQLDELQLNQQDMAMKMEYFKMLGDMKLPELPDTSDLSGLKNKKINFPSKLSLDTSGVSVPDTNGYVSKVLKKLDYNKRKDSLKKETTKYTAEYTKYKGKYDSLTNAIEKTKALLENYKNGNVKEKVTTASKEKITTTSKERAGSNPYLSKVQNILSTIKKFEVGLCNPSYSVFLVNGSPLRGINIELENENRFFAVTYGTTVNALLYNPNNLQGKLEGIRNAYNYFDFSNLSVGRKILAVKGGGGKREGTHLFVGLLVGRGRTDYLKPFDPNSTKESNVVLELDGRYEFSPQLSMDAVAGKSSLQTGELSVQQLKTAFKEIASSYRSNAVQVKVNYNLLQTKTKISLSGRIIDPYFKSFGTGFIRSDNMRYEMKVEQTITKNIKYTIAYRKEEDNLLNILNYKNTLQTINNTLSLKLKKHIALRLNYSPLFRQLRNGDHVVKDQNHISNVILTCTPKIKEVQANFNAMYSRYRITSDSGNIHFDNVTYTHLFQFKNGFKTGITISWFENSLKDTTANSTYMGILDAGYTFKNQNSFSLGGKVAYKPGIQTQYGFIAKLTFKLHSSLFMEIEAEKILNGDYYNSFLEEQIRKFPYYLSSKLIINF